MCMNDSSVSPYLRCRLRSYQEAIRQRGERPRPEDRINASGPNGAAPNQISEDSAASRIPKRDRCREGEARHQSRRQVP